MPCSTSSIASLQAFVATLGFSAFIGCAGAYRPAHELPPDDLRLTSIEADCRSLYSGTKPAVAPRAIRDCVDRRVAALFEPPPPPETAEERRDRERFSCRTLKSVAMMDCLYRIDHPRPVEPEPILTPEERRERDLRNCRFLGKIAYVNACIERVRGR